jgi:hypothetical protein
MEIRPFRVAIAQESLDDLRSRLDRIRWTSDIPGEGPDYGMSLAWCSGWPGTGATASTGGPLRPG